MKLVDQWHAMEADFPPDWEDVRLTLTAEQASDLPRAAQVLGSIHVGRVGDTLVFNVRSGAGPQGKHTALRLFERLDRDRIWCHIEQSNVKALDSSTEGATVEALRASGSVAESWDRALAPLPFRLDRSPLRARDRVEHAARSRGAPLRTAEPGAERLPPRLHVPLLGPLRLRRLPFDGAPLLRAARRRGHRRLRIGCSRHLRRGQRRHPGACVARGWQDAVASAALVTPALKSVSCGRKQSDTAPPAACGQGGKPSCS